MDENSIEVVLMSQRPQPCSTQLVIPRDKFPLEVLRKIFKAMLVDHFSNHPDQQDIVFRPAGDWIYHINELEWSRDEGMDNLPDAEKAFKTHSDGRDLYEIFFAQRIEMSNITLCAAMNTFKGWGVNEFTNPNTLSEIILRHARHIKIVFPDIGSKYTDTEMSFDASFKFLMESGLDAFENPNSLCFQFKDVVKYWPSLGLDVSASLVLELLPAIKACVSRRELRAIKLETLTNPDECDNGFRDWGVAFDKTLGMKGCLTKEVGNYVVDVYGRGTRYSNENPNRSPMDMYCRMSQVWKVGKGWLVVKDEGAKEGKI